MTNPIAAVPLRINADLARKGSVERRAHALVFHDVEDRDRWLARVNEFLAGASCSLSAQPSPIEVAEQALVQVDG